MNNIALKNSANVDVTFQVVRQPSATQSAILMEVNTSPGMTREGLAKIELSTRIVNGRTQPYAAITVPYGAVVNGAYVKQGQVTDNRGATQPANSTLVARLDAANYAKNLATNAQVVALFETGLVS